MWEQHIQWTRLFIVSNLANLPDLDFTTQRLLRNPEDFARVFSIFFGRNAARRFKDLFTEHLLIAADLVNSAKAGDNAAVETARREWFKNADEIAAFLAEINPFWEKREWQRMLYDHLKRTEDEAVFRLQGKYAEDIDNYEKIEDMALMMADYMTSGIFKKMKF